MSDAHATLAAILRRRAGESPDRLAYGFLDDRGDAWAELGYAELDARARAVAAALQAAGGPGERALLLHPPGPGFVAGLFGCMLAGAVAVPAYPPDPRRLERTLPRLRAIALDSEPAVVLAPGALVALREQLCEQAPELKALRWLATDELPAGVEFAWRGPGPEPGSLAILQYTSGSTGAPKGVMLSHANLVANSRFIRGVFGITPESILLGWLPLYHDMGLCGMTLQPLYAGCPVLLMSPESFLGRPSRWLEAVTRYRVSVSGGPNFAYELCLRKTTEAERGAYDLGSWKVAFSGAEPVRPDTLRRFAAAFAPAGLRWEALAPCYGLAESTLMVAGSRAGDPPATLRISGAALRRGRVADPGPGGDALEVVSSGPVPAGVDGHDVVVVDPDLRRRCAPGEVGEIWVAGASVAQGYWRRPDATREVFEARLEGGSRAYLRTGDLGFIRGAELFVTGRLKDLIVIRGRNHYPHDLEASVERSHPALRVGCGAAFSIDTARGEELVVVHEVSEPDLDVSGILGAVQRAVWRDHELRLAGLALLAPRTLPKTSSGKVQRRACRQAFLDGTLGAIAEWRMDAASPASRDRA